MEDPSTDHNRPPSPFGIGPVGGDHHFWDVDAAVRSPLFDHYFVPDPDHKSNVSVVSAFAAAAAAGVTYTPRPIQSPRSTDGMGVTTGASTQPNLDHIARLFQQHSRPPAGRLWGRVLASQHQQYGYNHHQPLHHATLAGAQWSEPHPISGPTLTSTHLSPDPSQDALAGYDASPDLEYVDPFSPSFSFGLNLGPWPAPHFVPASTTAGETTTLLSSPAFGVSSAQSPDGYPAMLSEPPRELPSSPVVNQCGPSVTAAPSVPYIKVCPDDESPVLLPSHPVSSGSSSSNSPTLSAAPTPQPVSLEIIQYTPAIGADGRTSKKRPAVDEEPCGVTSHTLRQKPFTGENGELQGQLITFGKRPKTRAIFSEEKRQQTAKARREGVCGRCKKSKRQCDLALKLSLYESCSLCTTTRIYKGVPRMPCFKSVLADVGFFRSGPASNEPFFTRRKTVYELGEFSKHDVSVRTLKLTQCIGEHQLTVYASEFVPQPGDVVSYKWKGPDGNRQTLAMPNFCLTNIEKVFAHICQYIEGAKWSYLDSLRTEDELSWMTISMAMKYALGRPDSLVADALHLWAVSRMIEIPWQMCGPDTLGVSRVDDPNNPHHGKIPIPPVMDTQLDQIFIKRILRPLRASILAKFEKMISPALPETWFEIYLTAFILLSHIERLAKHSVFHARLHTMPTKYSNVPFLEGVFHTAKVILSRFHFVCNGHVPLRLDWTSKSTVAMAKLKPAEVEFMKETQALVKAKEEEVLDLRKSRKYEECLYWCHQLYFDKWDSSPIESVDD